MSKKRPAKGPRQPAPPPAAPLPARKPNTRLYDAIAAGLVAILIVVLVAMSRTPATWPEDSFSDMHTLLAGENFAKYGLVKLRFLPVQYAGPGQAEHFRYYTHYPPLPDVVNGLVRILGITSLSGMRIVSGLFGIAGIFLLSRAIGSVLGPLAGVCALAAGGFSGYFFSYGVSVHQHPFNLLFLGLFALALVRALAAERIAWRWWATAWAALMLGALCSFEFIIYCQAFAWVYALAAGRVRKYWPMLLALLAAPVAGVGLHFLQNVWALGWDGAWADKLGYGQYGGENRSEALRRLRQMLTANITRCYHWGWYVLPLAAGLFAAARWLDRKAAGPARPALALLVAAAVAPWAWYIGMAAHAHHPHTVNQLLLLLMAAGGGLLAMMVDRLLRPGDSLPLQLALAGGAVLFTLYVNEFYVTLVAAVVALLAMMAALFLRSSSTVPLKVVLLSCVCAVTLCGHGAYQAAGARIEKAKGPVEDYWVLMEALGKQEWPEGTALLYNRTPEAYYSYFLRNYSTLCPRRELMFLPGPQKPRPPLTAGETGAILRQTQKTLNGLDEFLPRGCSYNQYLYFPDDQEWLFEILRTTCPGKVLAMETAQGRVQSLGVLLFDISALHEPPETRKPLPDSVREAQARGQFEPWAPPGLAERFRSLKAQYAN